MNTYIHVHMYMCFDKKREKDEMDFHKYIHNLFNREMGERFRREVLAHGGEIPPKDLING